MNKKEISKLKVGDKIFHKQLRKCAVVGILFDQNGSLFGIKLQPVYYSDRMKLSSCSGMHPNVPLLETTYGLIKQL